MKKHPTASQVFASAVANWKIVVLGMMIAILTTTTFYFVTQRQADADYRTPSLPDATIRGQRSTTT